jgi:hypothetical protein
MLFADNEEKSTPPPSGLLIGIYLFYENWSIETFRKKESKKRAVCSGTSSYRRPYSRIEDYGLIERKTTLKSAEAIGHPLE